MATRANEKDVQDRKVVETLNRLYSESVPKVRRAGRQSAHSWTVVADGLGFNTGYIYRVAKDDKRASNKLLHALGLPMRTVAVSVCPHCGLAPLAKRHVCPGTEKPRKPSARTRRKRLWNSDAWRAVYASFSRARHQR